MFPSQQVDVEISVKWEIHEICNNIMILQISCVCISETSQNQINIRLNESLNLWIQFVRVCTTHIIILYAHVHIEVRSSFYSNEGGFQFHGFFLFDNFYKLN